MHLRAFRSPEPAQSDPSRESVAGTQSLAEKSKGHPRSMASHIEEMLLQRLVKALGNPPLIVSLWNGETVSSATERASNAVRVDVHDRNTLWRVLLDPFFEFPEAYANGQIEIEGDLTDFMRLVDDSAVEAPRAIRWFTSIARGLHWAHRNSAAAAKENIHHHYDIGNDFYRLWLDENLLYSCAYFEEPGASLEQAQRAKMDHVCRKLWLGPGETVIEAGCGWGAFALHMAEHYGVRVRAYNISSEQIELARRQAQDRGLNHRVEFIHDDWRNITGQCDAFVSIGMLEHIGPRHYGQLGDVIHRCLSRDGRALIHTIGRNRMEPMDPWIERRIFPAAYPPSLWQIRPVFEPHAFSVLDIENLRLHYAETLRHWLARYEKSLDTIRHTYDERFVRIWRMYLASSIAAFETGSLQLFQILFAHPRNNRVPMTRSHQYEHLTSRVEEHEQSCGPVGPFACPPFYFGESSLEMRGNRPSSPRAKSAETGLQNQGDEP